MCHKLDQPVLVVKVERRCRKVDLALIVREDAGQGSRGEPVVDQAPQVVDEQVRVKHSTGLEDDVGHRLMQERYFVRASDVIVFVVCLRGLPRPVNVTAVALLAGVLGVDVLVEQEVRVEECSATLDGNAAVKKTLVLAEPMEADRKEAREVGCQGGEERDVQLGQASFSLVDVC